MDPTDAPTRHRHRPLLHPIARVHPAFVGNMSSNPRRTPVTRPDAGSLSLKTNMVLRKGATFHSPTTPTSTPEAARFQPPSLPRRSHTSLDDAMDANVRRVAVTISDIDSILNLSKKTSPSLFLDDSLPIPRGLLVHALDSSIMSEKHAGERRVLRPRNRRASRHHESDSGLGTSIDSTPEKQAGPSMRSQRTVVKSSALMKSAAGTSASSAALPGLGPRATNLIIKHTLKPLLVPSFKIFHPLVLECPAKIQRKEIVCLRDVEKTLLLLAPVSQLRTDKGIRGDTYRALCLKEKATSVKLYLAFCLTTIRCLQATVESSVISLSDREQIRPGDRPYNSGYFIDLIDQMRRYAQQLADANKLGGEADEMSVDPYVYGLRLSTQAQIANICRRTDEIKLHGGMTVNGRHAELVRVKKNGKAISLATGLPVDVVGEQAKDVVRIKRSKSEELEDEEEIMRSMARRKKNASPEELAPKMCSEPGCNKQFSRPCDLTKHAKTHSRPWKCSVSGCKYTEFGWPTEKERDRHFNDKHSAAPQMYRCQFQDCAYQSKRESNCKQHMEKTHNWVYNRTKTNGKKGRSVSGSVTQTTPGLVNLPTPPSDYSFGIATPPNDHFYGAVYNNNTLDFPSYNASEPAFDTIPQDFQLDFSPIDNATPSTDSGADRNSAYQDIGNDFVDEDIYAAPAHISAPMHNLFHKEYPQQFAQFTAAEMAQPEPAPYLSPTAPYLSPTGQASAMLSTPISMAGVDEGFDEQQDCMAMNGDFVLFPNHGDMEMSKPLWNNELFTAEVPSHAAGFSQPNSQDFMNTLQNVDWSQPTWSQPEYAQFLQQ